MTTAKHTPGPWQTVDYMARAEVIKGPDGQDLVMRQDGASIADMRLMAAAPRMAAALHRAAHILAELPNQSPQLLALRTEVVETIKQATPEHYGIKPDELPQDRATLEPPPRLASTTKDRSEHLEHALRMAAAFIESGESAGHSFFEVREAWRAALAD